MYSAEDKRRAVELFVKYDLSCASAINELGYPSRGSLYEWHRSYLEHGDSAFGPDGCRRYADRQKRAAVDYFLDHGKCIARTIRALGYPRSKESLASWIDELEPGLRPKRATGKRCTEDQASNAAIESLKPGEHPVGHSDRGCHYRWPGWIERCERHGIVRSMSKKGCSPDNSAMEGFFGRMKVEFFYGRCWDEWSAEDFMDAIDDYIHWYNEGRIKLSLGGMSPVQYRQSLGLAA